MKKNVTILDMLGNIIGTTYPKRAKGLVKSGRAYLVDGETVQLVCPPEQSIQKQQEDIAMNIEIEKEDLMEQKKVWDSTVESIEENEQVCDNITSFVEEKEKLGDIAEKAEEKETLLEAEKEKNEEISKNAKKLLDAGISLKDILHNLNTLREDSGYINHALDNLEKLPYVAPAAGAPIDTSISARAEAIADIVKCRETTNQIMIKLYSQIYTDYMA